MSFKNRKLKPWRLLPPHQIIGEFSTDYLGDEGSIVKITANDPDADVFYDAGNGVTSAQYPGVSSQRWVQPRKVSLAASGDLASEILGITLQGTQEVGEHGIPTLLDRRKANENNYVASGHPVQIALGGTFYLSLENIEGIPTPGAGLVAADGGKVAVVDAGTVADPKLLIGKCLSTSGSRQGDAQVLFHF